MNESINSDIFRSYVLDYLGIYNFYEEEELVEVNEKGEYILENLKRSNRFDYDGASYTFTRFNNISEGRTKKDVPIEIHKDDINVNIDGEVTHLDLIYKMDVKQLEDHKRVTTRISQRSQSVSALLYINNKDSDDFVKALEEVRKYQEYMAGNGGEDR